MTPRESVLAIDLRPAMRAVPWLRRPDPAAVMEAGRARGLTLVNCIIGASRVAPSLDSWLISGVASLLANEAASSDALLVTADLLEAMAGQALADGLALVSEHLSALADLPRELAPLRAGVRP